MIRKNILLISLIFFLTHCGYTPIYLQNTDVNFSIEKVSYTGDREINNFLFIIITFIYFLILSHQTPFASMSESANIQINILINWQGISP